MIAQEEKDQLAPKMIIMWIIWGAMFISLFIYIAVCHMVAQTFKPTLSEDFPLTLFTNILIVVGCSELVLAFFLKKFLLKVMSGKKGQNTEGLSGYMVFGKYMVVLLITLAISESVGIYGMVLFFMTLQFQLLYPFMIVAAIAMLFFRPKMDELIALHGTPEDQEKT